MVGTPTEGVKTRCLAREVSSLRVARFWFVWMCVRMVFYKSHHTKFRQEKKTVFAFYCSSTPPAKLMMEPVEHWTSLPFPFFFVSFFFLYPRSTTTARTPHTHAHTRRRSFTFQSHCVFVSVAHEISDRDFASTRHADCRALEAMCAARVELGRSVL